MSKSKTALIIVGAAGSVATAAYKVSGSFRNRILYYRARITQRNSTSSRRSRNFPKVGSRIGNTSETQRRPARRNRAFRKGTIRWLAEQQKTNKPTPRIVR